MLMIVIAIAIVRVMMFINVLVMRLAGSCEQVFAGAIVVAAIVVSSSSGII